MQHRGLLDDDGTDVPIGVARCRCVRQSENVSDDPINRGGLYCYDCIARVLCPEAHCDPNDPTPVRHDPLIVDLTSIARAVSVYHGRALCLPCLATYLDGA